MDNSLIKKLKPHFLPIVLGVAGLMFLGYGLMSLSAAKKDKQDILFESANDTSPFAEKKLSEAKSASGGITVDIEGAVQKPGVYKLSSDARVQDAMIAAGGMSDKADREKVSKGLNLAAKIPDGGKIYIPFVGDPSTSFGIASSGQNVLGAETSSALININSASASELDKLQGVGPVTAEKIISNRPYGAIEELVSKKIVGQKVFEGIKDKITVY